MSIPNKTFTKGSWTLCWDCSKAVGGCPWSDKLVPVKGWVADELIPSNTKPYTTYLVKQCPLFDRDAYEGGTRRTPRKDIKL